VLWCYPRYLVAASAVLMGQLELVAPILAMCFLTCYLTINAACFVLAIMRAPSWRPRWAYFHWSTSLLGAVMCLVTMFLIKVCIGPFAASHAPSAC